MVHRHFVRFLEDPHVYQECRQFWEQLTSKIASSIELVKDWRSWIPRAYANGIPMELEDVPIWDGRSDQLGRAYQIIQSRAGGDELEISAWITSYEEEYVEMPRHELFINLSFSEESADIAAVLLRRWMTPQTTLGEMRDLIVEMIPDVPLVDPVR